MALAGCVRAVLPLHQSFRPGLWRIRPLVRLALFVPDSQRHLSDADKKTQGDD